MSDVQVSVVAIDSAIDCFEKISEAAINYQKVVQYDISELKSSIAHKMQTINEDVSSLYGRLSCLDEDDDCRREEILSEIQNMRAKLEKLNVLHNRIRRLEAQYQSESMAIVSAVSNDVSTGIRSMATYLRQINSIDGPVEGGSTGTVSNVYTGDSNYCVVIIDSARYPQSAEHIRAAINSGHPAMLTLNRSGADENRKQSLAHVPTSPVYDRDEYPPAAFEEGGVGADVAYINSSDNQGSGSSFRWQLDGIPDGTRVRFRVI